MLWSARLWAICLIALLFLPACGYQLTAQSPIILPAGNTKLYLKKVTNPTTETWFEPMVRTSLRDEFTRRGNVEWVDQEAAQSLVYVDVRQYSTSGSVTGQNEETLKSRAMVHMEISFYSADTHALIWNSGPVVASESYRGTGSKRDATQKAIDLAMRIAADRLSQNF